MSTHQITPKSNEMTNINDKELSICQDKLGYPKSTTPKLPLQTNKRLISGITGWEEHCLL